jgi:hypothetical protein
MPAFEKFILPYKENCHMIIENNGSADANIEAIIEKIKLLAHPTVTSQLT